jgi:hypothetical protein
MLQRTETGRRQCQVVPRRLIDDGEGVARNSSPTRSPSTRHGAAEDVPAPSQKDAESLLDGVTGDLLEGPCGSRASRRAEVSNLEARCRDDESVEVGAEHRSVIRSISEVVDGAV